MNKEKIVSFFLEQGFLLSPDFLDSLSDGFNIEESFEAIITKINSREKPLLLNKDLFLAFDKSEDFLDINWAEFERARALSEKGANGRIYKTFLDILNYNISEEKREELDVLLKEIKEPGDVVLDENGNYSGDNVVVLKSYRENPKKRMIGDFVSYFKVRYDSLKKILRGKQELQNAVSINRLLGKRGREQVALIGAVYDKTVTKNGNILLTLEDLSGSITVLINKNKGELFELAEELVLDEVIGVVGLNGNRIVFANKIIFPGVPTGTGMKKMTEEVYAAFISDLHVGSKMFLYDNFLKFVKWLRGEVGSFKHRGIAKKIKYLFIVGDLVDGVGIYPEQEIELEIKEIEKQYEKCAELLAEIPRNIKIIICPGNHDALRIAEPQPVLYKKFSEALWGLPNIIMVSNPSLVNIGSSKDFSGFDVLLYHGYSFDYYFNSVEKIRNSGGYDRVDLLMKLLLEKRHLAPSHSSTLYIPDSEKDVLVIEKVPDFFVSGHIHKANISHYNNITIICCSCWQSKTSFQERVGHDPEPARVPIVNLKTREVKMLKFT